MSQRLSGYARRADDTYETPPWVTQVVAPYLDQHCLYPWDPANGPTSKIAQVLRDDGFHVIATNDNFLARTSLPYARIDGICTNPPYGFGGRLACRFIEHALELVLVVAMLLRVDFNSGKTRTNLFRDCPAFAGKIVLLDRIVWFECEGAPGPSDNHCWFIWNAKHRGPPTIQYARRVGA
jgi:hypothetical protein